MIKLVESEGDIDRCFAVMVQLRTQLKRTEFVTTIKRMQSDGYQLASLEEEGEVRALAGFRIIEMLARGKFMYVDDLITDAEVRSQGYGDQLFDWLVDYAKEQGCQLLDLDSGVQRFDAHRFYFRKRMHIPAYHFALHL
jgi:GNAT superfamily N-acetyltransferase